MFLVGTYQITKAILSAHIEQEQTEQIQQITHIKQNTNPTFNFSICAAGHQ